MKFTQINFPSSFQTFLNESSLPFLKTCVSFLLQLSLTLLNHKYINRIIFLNDFYSDEKEENIKFL